MKRIWLLGWLGVPMLAHHLLPDPPSLPLPEVQSFQARDAGKGDDDYQKGLSALDSHDWDGQ